MSPSVSFPEAPALVLFWQKHSRGWGVLSDRLHIPPWSPGIAFFSPSSHANLRTAFIMKPEQASFPICPNSQSFSAAPAESTGECFTLHPRGVCGSDPDTLDSCSGTGKDEEPPVPAVHGAFRRKIAVHGRRSAAMLCCRTSGGSNRINSLSARD